MSAHSSRSERWPSITASSFFVRSCRVSRFFSMFSLFWAGPCSTSRRRSWKESFSSPICACVSWRFCMLSRSSSACVRASSMSLSSIAVTSSFSEPWWIRSSDTCAWTAWWLCFRWSRCSAVDFSCSSCSSQICTRTASFSSFSWLAESSNWCSSLLGSSSCTSQRRRSSICRSFSTVSLAAFVAASAVRSRPSALRPSTEPSSFSKDLRASSNCSFSSARRLSSAASSLSTRSLDLLSSLRTGA
mmetsp:Transcript_57463/g.168737  ORF Transcript_57463/g.168737 Transcript_57463/m.168737 type:complete len:245 (-) Transcript_57463:380-1114(-)